MIYLMRSIMQAHQPTWANCHQLLLTLFNTEGHRRVTLAALQWPEDHATDAQGNIQAWAQAQFPDTDPRWDPNNEEDFQKIKRDQEGLVGGLKEGERKAPNMNKMSEVLQKPTL